MKGVVWVFLGACSYGILSTMVVLAYRAGFTLNDVIGAQMLLGTLILWAFFALKKRDSRYISLTTSSGMSLLLSGITTGTTGLLYYASLQYLNPALAVVLFLQFTWMGIVIDSTARRAWPTKSQVIALVLIFLGTILATNILKEGPGSFHILGVCLGLLAAFSNAVRVYTSGKVAVKVDPVLRSAIMVTGGTILTSLIVPPTFLLDFTTFKHLFSTYGIPLAFFGSFFGMWAFAKGAPLISGSMAAILSSMQLPVTILLALFVLKVPVETLQFLGVAFILLGIAAASIKTQSSTKTVDLKESQ